jgi:hypothetical protein
MSSRKKRFRTKLVVDHAVQARIILETSLPMVGCLVFAVLVEGFYRRQVAAGAIQSDGTLLGMPEERLGMLLLFVSAATMQLVSGLLSSQKVAGAAFRIRKGLEEFRAGATGTRIRLRGGDYHHSLADDINGFLDWVESGAAPAAEGAATGRATGAGSPQRADAPGPRRPDQPADARPR